MRLSMRMIVGFLFILGVLLMLIIVIEGATGEIIVVAKDSNGDYEKIQYAIDNATAGDKIRVWEGTYEEEIVVNTKLSIIGNGSTDTKIDGGSNDDVVDVRTSNVTISGFRIVNSGSGARDAAIRVYRVSDCKISNISIDNCDNGLYIYDSNSITIVDISISSNSEHGIYSRQSNDIRLCNLTLFSNNDDGINIYNGRNIIIEQTTSYSNGGDGIFISDSINISLKTVFCFENQNGINFWKSSNSAIQSSTMNNNENGIHLWEASSIGILSCEIFDNNDGISIEYHSANTTTTNSSFESNKIGISVTGSSRNSICNDSVFIDNDDYGIFVGNNDDYQINARNNYWGYPSGPYHETDNPDGEGDTVSDDVVFNPWQDTPKDYFEPEAIIDIISPNPALEGNDVIFIGDGICYESIVTYSWTSDIDGEVYLGGSNESMRNNLTKGNHNITFKIKDNFGHWSPDINISLRINEQPVSEIYYMSDKVFMKGENITFSGFGTDDIGISGYKWTSSIDGLLNNSSEFTTNNLSVGSHTIFFQVQDNDGAWSESSFVTIYVNTRPTATIEDIIPSSPTEGDNIHFTAYGNDNGIIVRYVWWSSQNGEFYNGSNPDIYIVFLLSGQHTITLKVQDDYDEWSDEVSINLTINMRPVAIIDFINPEVVLFGESIQFSGHGENGTITEYEWISSKNGIIGEEPRFNRTKFEVGRHTISFIVINEEGVRSYEATQEIYVNTIPIAFLDEIIPSNPTEGEPIQFVGHGTDNGAIVRYSVISDVDGDIYNGSTSGLYSFRGSLSGGTHVITFKVLDSYGYWSDEVNTSIYVNIFPIIEQVSISPNTALLNESIEFYVSATDDGEIVGYEWYSDIDGLLYNGTVPNFQVDTLSEGNHDITIKVQDNLGYWSNEVNSQIIIHLKPIARIISVSPNPAQINEEVVFTGNGLDDNAVLIFSWRIDGNIFYSGPNSTFSTSALVAGNHDVSLKVQDSNGIWSDDANTILIIDEAIIPNKIPIISISHPMDEDVVSGKVIINGTVSDEDGNISHVSLTILGTTTYIYNITIDGQGPWEYEWDTEDWGNTNYWITVQCFDGTNYSEEVHRNVRVNNKGGDSGDSEGFLPGFELMAVVGAIGVTMELYRKKRR